MSEADKRLNGLGDFTYFKNPQEDSVNPKEKQEYSSSTIQGLNQRVSELEKKIAILEELIKGK